MDINKFKLLQGGVDGVKTYAIERIPRDNMIILDEVERTRRIPLSKELRDKIQNLKYFYLNLTSHWISPFNAYFDLKTYTRLPLVERDGKIPMGQELLYDIWNHTEITGVTMRNAGFVITGNIEVVVGKKIGISTPFITEEDDLSFYLDAVNKIEDIMHDMSVSIETKALPMPDSQQMMLTFGEKEETVKTMSFEELEKKFLDHLVENNAIVIIDEDSFKGLSEGEGKAKLNTNTNSIDSHNVPEAKEEKSEEQLTAEKLHEENIEKKAKPKTKPVNSTLVSDAKFNVDLNGPEAKLTEVKKGEKIPDGGTMEDLEYSHNMGLNDQVDGGPGIEQTEDDNDKKAEW